MKTKKQWEQPVVKVFARSTAEESVLANCKNMSISAPGPMGPNCTMAPQNCRADIAS